MPDIFDELQDEFKSKPLPQAEPRQADIFDQIQQEGTIGQWNPSPYQRLEAAFPAAFQRAGTIADPEHPRGSLPAAWQAANKPAGIMEKVLPELKVTHDDSIFSAVGKETYNILSGIPKFASSPLGIATFGTGAVSKAAGKIVAKVFQADMLKNLGESVHNLYENWGTMSPGERVAAIEDGLASGIFAKILHKHAWAGEPVKPIEIQKEKPAEAPATPAEALAASAKPQAEIPAGAVATATGELSDISKPVGTTQTIARPEVFSVNSEEGVGHYVTDPEGNQIGDVYENIADAKFHADNLNEVAFNKAEQERIAAKTAAVPEIGTATEIEGVMSLGEGRYQSETAPPVGAFNVVKVTIGGKSVYKFRLPKAKAPKELGAVEAAPAAKTVKPEQERLKSVDEYELSQKLKDYTVSELRQLRDDHESDPTQNSDHVIEIINKTIAEKSQSLQMRVGRQPAEPAKPEKPEQERLDEESLGSFKLGLSKSSDSEIQYWKDQIDEYGKHQDHVLELINEEIEKRKGSESGFKVTDKADPTKPAEPAAEAKPVENGLDDVSKLHVEQNRDAAGGVDIVTDVDLRRESKSEEAGTSENQPFSLSRHFRNIAEHLQRTAGIATIDTIKKRIVFNAQALNDFLKGVPPERRAAAVRAIISEERIHLHTENADAVKYWNSLSRFEKWAIRKKYDIDPSLMNDTLWGHEAVRYRLQQLMRMTPSEIAKEFGGKGSARRRLAIKSIDILEAIVRKTRSIVSKTATKEMTAILDKIQEALKSGKMADADLRMVERKPYETTLTSEAAELEKQAEDFRKAGLFDEADELMQMAEWSRSKAYGQKPPLAKGPKPGDEDPNQRTFDTLLNRAKFEEIHRVINETGDRLFKKNEAEMFRQAQLESGQPPIMEIPLSRGKNWKATGEDAQEYKLPIGLSYDNLYEIALKNNVSPERLQSIYEELVSLNPELSGISKSQYGKDSQRKISPIRDVIAGVASKFKAENIKYFVEELNGSFRNADERAHQYNDQKDFKGGVSHVVITPDEFLEQLRLPLARGRKKLTPPESEEFQLPILPLSIKRGKLTSQYADAFDDVVGMYHRRNLDFKPGKGGDVEKIEKRQVTASQKSYKFAFNFSKNNWEPKIIAYVDRAGVEQMPERPAMYYSEKQKKAFKSKMDEFYGRSLGLAIKDTADAGEQIKLSDHEILVPAESIEDASLIAKNLPPHPSSDIVSQIIGLRKTFEKMSESDNKDEQHKIWNEYIYDSIKTPNKTKAISEFLDKLEPDSNLPLAPGRELPEEGLAKQIKNLSYDELENVRQMSGDKNSSAVKVFYNDNLRNHLMSDEDSKALLKYLKLPYQQKVYWVAYDKSGNHINVNGRNKDAIELFQSPWYENSVFDVFSQSNVRNIEPVILTPKKGIIEDTGTHGFYGGEKAKTYGISHDVRIQNVNYAKLRKLYPDAEEAGGPSLVFATKDAITSLKNLAKNFTLPLAPGRGRPKKDRIDPWAKGLMFEPEQLAPRGGIDQYERKLEEGQLPKLPTADEISMNAAGWIAREMTSAEKEGKQYVPDFKKFSGYMSNNFKTKAGQVKELYQNLLVANLQNARGESLQNIIKAVFGKEHPFSKMRIPDKMTETGGLELEQSDLFKDPVAEILRKARTPMESKGISESEMRQRMRSKAVSMIVKRLIEPMMENDAEVLNRKEISPSELSPVGAAEGISSGYQELSAQDEFNTELPDVLVDRNRRSANDRASISKRLTVIMDRKTGKVHMVSTWRNPTSGKVFFTNPLLKTGEGLYLYDALKNYRLLRSVLLDEPLERFSQSYESLKDYNKKFGNEAFENYSKETSYDPDTIPIEDFSNSESPNPNQVMVDPYGRKIEIPSEEGIQGEGGSMVGPAKSLVESQIGMGKSAVEESIRSKITRREAMSVSEAFSEADTPEKIREVLSGLHQENFSKLRESFQKATVKLDRALEAFRRALGKGGVDFTSLKEGEYSNEQVERSIANLSEVEQERINKVQASIPKLQQAVANASRDFRKNTLLRSGVAKIAKRVQASARIQAVEDLMNRLVNKIQTLNQVFDTHEEFADALTEREVKRVEKPAEKGTWTPRPPGKKMSAYEQAKRGLDLPSEKLAFKDKPGKPVVPTSPENLSPAPPKPIETINGEEFKRIVQGSITAEMRSGEATKLSREDEIEIEKYLAEEKTRKEWESFLEKRRADLSAINPKTEKFQLQGQVVEKPKDVSVDKETMARFMKIRNEQRQKQGILPMSLGRGAIKAVSDSFADSVAKFAAIGAAWTKRANADAVISAGADAYQTSARTFAAGSGNKIRIQALKNGAKLLGRSRKVENLKILGGAIAMHATRAIRKTFVYSNEATAAFDEAAKDSSDMKIGHMLLNATDMHSLKLAIKDAFDHFEFKGKESVLSNLLARINKGAGQVAVRNDKGQTVGWKDADRAISADLRKAGLEMIKEAERRIENNLVERGLLTHTGATYKIDDFAKSKLEEFALGVNIGIARANKMLKEGGMRDRRVARAWLKDLEKHKNDLEFAMAHWSDPQLREATIEAQKEFDAQYDRESAAGSKLSYNDAYLPGRYDGQFHNNDSIEFGPSRILGRQTTKARVFKNYYEAASSGPYIAASHNIADILEHRVRQGMTKIGLRGWEADLISMTDEATGKPAFIAAKKVGEGFVPDLPPGTSGADYVAVNTSSTRTPIFALAGDYAKWLTRLTAPSRVDDWAVAKGALQAGQALKHVALVGDIFHLARVTYYGASIIGRKAFAPSAHSDGWATLDIHEADLKTAFEKGFISEKAYKWSTEKLPVTFNGVKDTMTRHQIAREYQKVGYNVGMISDAIYKDLVRNVPVIGSYNKFLFDHYQRGLMMRSALDEFQRRHKLDPNRDSRILMREISHDLNGYFGSIGKQGWVKSATFQDLLRIPFLAPQWVEGIIKKDIAIPYKLIGSLKDGIEGPKRLLRGDETSARGITRGLMGMLVLTQVINVISRGQPTWNNEEGHKMQADLGDNVWLDPMAVFNETISELVRYSETKEDSIEAIKQVGENKLGFVGRAGLVLGTRKTFKGREIHGVGNLLGQTAKTLVPVPITINAPVQEMIYKLSGGKYSEPTTAQQAKRSFYGVLGFKVEAGRRADQEMALKAKKFVDENKLKSSSTTVNMSDEPSYSDIRRQLDLGNLQGAKNALLAIRERGVSDKQIIAAMKRWENAPFAGSRANELLWIHSMDASEMELYQKAIEYKRDLYYKWIDFYTNEPE